MLGIAHLTQGLEAPACVGLGEDRSTHFHDDAGVGPDVDVFPPVEAVESQKEAILCLGHGSGHPLLEPGQIRRESSVDRLCVVDNPFDD